MRLNIHLWSCVANFFSEQEMFQKKCVEKIKPHILSPIIFFFFPGNRTVYEIMWKNLVQTERKDLII